MIKELQDKVSKLQSESAKKDVEFNQKRLYYQEIISKLQQENEKLRMMLDEASKLMEKPQSESMLQEIAEINNSEDRNLNGRNINNKVSLDEGELKTVEKENSLLRNELVELSRSYKQQIEELTMYFEKIRNAYYAKQSVTIAEDHTPGQVLFLVNAYETLMKDFDSQRVKFIDKIEQLTNFIISCQRKIKQMSADIKRLDFEAAVAQEELKIFKRSTRMVD